MAAAFRGTRAKIEVPAPRPATESKSRWAAFSYGRTGFWVVLIPVAYFFGWLASVLFVAVVSLYANAAGDFAAARADTDPQLDRIEDKLDWLIERSAA